MEANPQHEKEKGNGSGDTLSLTRDGVVDFVSKTLAHCKVRTNLLAILVLIAGAVFCDRKITAGIERVNVWEKTLNMMRADCVRQSEQEQWEAQLASANLVMLTNRLIVPSSKAIRAEREQREKERRATMTPMTD